MLDRFPETQEVEKCLFPDRAPMADYITFGGRGHSFTLAWSDAWMDVRADALAQAIASYESRTRPREFRENVEELCRWMDFFVFRAREGVEDADRAYADGYRLPAGSGQAPKRNAQLLRAREAAHAAYRGRVRKAAAKLKALRRIISTQDIIEEYENRLKADLERVAKGD